MNQYSLVFSGEDRLVIKIETQDYGTMIDFPTMVASFGMRFAGWYLNIELTEPFTYLTMPAKNLALYPKWEIDALNLPVMSITINQDIMSVGKEDYIDATISMLNTDQSYEFTDKHALFRGRGNGSWWNFDKKGYKIKFDDRIGLLGEDESKQWVIIPGTYDYSSVHNFFAYRIVNDVLDGIEYTSSANLIEVYVNGNYHGVYTLCEQVRVEEGRVDISSEYGVLDTGYLIEYDSYASGTYGIDYFSVSGLKYPFTVKSPDPDDYHEVVSESTYRAQVAYIRDYTSRLIYAILHDDFDTVKELADVDSLVDMYIIHELFKNTDTGWSSFYMYKKPGGKMFFGPAWDFDFTAGVSRGDSSYGGFYVSDFVRQVSDYTSSEIYIALMKQDEFVDLFIARYLEIADELHDEINRLYLIIQPYADSFARDAILWSWQSDWEEDQNKLRIWLINRNQWLNNWAEDHS